MKAKINSIVQKEIDAINNIPIDGIVESVIEVLYKRIHQKKGKLIVSGMGKAGQIGMNMATTLSSTGTPSLFLHPSEAQHGDLGIIQENDVLLLISNSGKTREILELNHIFSNEKCFALKVQGNSMIDAGINDGDWVIIEKNNKIIKSKVLAILIDNQEVTLKFAKLVDKKLIQLIPANKNLKPKSYNLERIEVQGIVIGQIRVL